VHPAVVYALALSWIVRAKRIRLLGEHQVYAPLSTLWPWRDGISTRSGAQGRGGIRRHTKPRERRQYVPVKLPGGGSVYPAYYLNHSYADCDVYVSLAKLKNHFTAASPSP